jgi:AraC-like DNA-binding protein
MCAGAAKATSPLVVCSPTISRAAASQYLAAWRMQLAAGMLREPATRVKQVAGAVGYESEAAFSRAFKRATGVAPAAWRDRRT